MPVAKDCADAGACLIGKSDAAEGFDDSRITNFLFGGVEQFCLCRKGIAGIPEDRAVGEQLDGGLASVVAVILMDQQVDGCFAEGYVIGRVIVAAQGGGIE